MSAFGNLETHEITLPMDYHSAFTLVKRTAHACGDIISDNETLGMVSYKTKLKLLSLKNPASVEVNVSKQTDGTLLRISVNSNDGLGLFRTSSRTYDTFIAELSAQSKL